MGVLVNLRDFEDHARRRMPRGVFDYFASGAADDITVRENQEAWARRRFRPRVGIDVSSCDLRTTVLGREMSMPIMLAPCGLNVLAHPEAEGAVARAAATTGVVQVVSSGSQLSLEEIAKVNAAPRWFQLYCLRDPGHTLDLVRRTEAAGYEAICLTVDAPIDGIREHNRRNAFQAPPPGMRWTNLVPYMNSPTWQPAWHDPSVTWKTVDWLRENTRLPIVLKGILYPDDAAEAVARGAAGLIVSNHGGRQLDTSITACDALPAIAEAVAGRIEIYADGGIRRGSDVLAALALGARAVLIGRPYLWGLSYDGEAGVVRILEILREELRVNLALTGCRRPSDASPALLARTIS